MREEVNEQIAKWFDRACSDAICDEFGAGDCTCAGFLIQARAEGMREAARIVKERSKKYDNLINESAGMELDAMAAAILSAIGERREP